jgi:hypothetical protein
MNASPQVWLWVSAIVSLIAGSLLVMNDSSAGWFLIIMGIIDIGATTRSGRGLAASNRGMIHWGLIVVTFLLVVLVLIAGAVLLLK